MNLPAFMSTFIFTPRWSQVSGGENRLHFPMDIGKNVRLKMEMEYNDSTILFISEKN